MKKYTKTAVVAVLMLVVSTIGFGIAFGYGGGAGAPIINGLWNGTQALGTGSNSPVITPASAPATTGQVLGVSTFVFNADLRQGASGDDVKQLQQRLTDDGVYSGPITGFFGPLTLSAVKAHQGKNGLPQTGFVGPMTRGVLNGSSTPAASNSNMTMSQFVEFLIQMGVISPEKAAAARQAVVK